MTSKFLKNITKQQWGIFIVGYVIVNLFFFGSSYLYNKVFDQQIMPYANIITSILISFMIHTSLLKKLIFIVVASLVGTFIGIALVILTMFIPGSKEHNYVMYQICWPAINKHYGKSPNEPLPHDQVDKNGLSKGWYQHSECENNFWAGKGPVFSENPPGFIPFKK